MWFLAASRVSSASWLCHVKPCRAVAGYFPPGVVLEEAGNRPALGWRLATWIDLDGIETGEPPVAAERLNYRDVLSRLPADRPELNHWADEAMRAHIARLRWYARRKPGDSESLETRSPGVQHAALMLRSLQGEYRRAGFRLAWPGSSPARRWHR